MVIILCKRKEINKINNKDNKRKEEGKGEEKEKEKSVLLGRNEKRKKGGKHSVILG